MVNTPYIFIESSSDSSSCRRNLPTGFSFYSPIQRNFQSPESTLTTFKGFVSVYLPGFRLFQSSSVSKLLNTFFFDKSLIDLLLRISIRRRLVPSVNIVDIYIEV